MSIQTTVIVALGDTDVATAVDLQVFFAGSGEEPVWTLAQVQEALDSLVAQGIVMESRHGYFLAPVFVTRGHLN